MKLSVILPSIRKEKIEGLYDSFIKSYSGEFEFIIVSPYDLPQSIKDKNNVRYFQSWSHPVCCQQIGLIEAFGEYVTRAVDDSLYVNGEMDLAFKKLDGNDMTAVLLKYTETNESVDRTHVDFQKMEDPAFYKLGYHMQTVQPYVSKEHLLLNFGIVPRKLLYDVGGWDCQFESVAIAELDLAIRLQLYGAKIILSDNIVLECGWLPGHEGDHGPVHDAFAPDMEKYNQIYSQESCKDRIVIDINNFENCPKKWERRFGK